MPKPTATTQRPGISSRAFLPLLAPAGGGVERFSTKLDRNPKGPRIMASKRTVEAKKRRAQKKAAKAASMKVGGHDSIYARKKRGIYPENSPYRTVWAQFA